MTTEQHPVFGEIEVHAQRPAWAVRNPSDMRPLRKPQEGPQPAPGSENGESPGPTPTQGPETASYDDGGGAFPSMEPEEAEEEEAPTLEEEAEQLLSQLHAQEVALLPPDEEEEEEEAAPLTSRVTTIDRNKLGSYARREVKDRTLVYLDPDQHRAPIEYGNRITLTEGEVRRAKALAKVNERLTGGFILNRVIPSSQGIERGANLGSALLEMLGDVDALPQELIECFQNLNGAALKLEFLDMSLAYVPEEVRNHLLKHIGEKLLMQALKVNASGGDASKSPVDTMRTYSLGRNLGSAVGHIDPTPRTAADRTGIRRRR